MTLFLCRHLAVIVAAGEASLYVDLLDGSTALEDLLLTGLTTPEMHQVWKEKLDCNSSVLVIRNFRYQSHTIGFFQTHSYFCHHCFDVEESTRDSVHDVFALDDDAETRIVRDNMSVYLTLELEPECLVNQREIDLP